MAEHKRILFIGDEDSSSVTQPTLFTPNITVGVNKVTWSRNSENGGFGDTVTATIENEVVTSPLSITENLDGKKLKIKAEAENFKSVESEVNLDYVEIKEATVTRNIVSEDGGKYYPYVELYNGDKAPTTNKLTYSYTPKSGTFYSGSYPIEFGYRVAKGKKAYVGGSITLTRISDGKSYTKTATGASSTTSPSTIWAKVLYNFGSELGDIRGKNINDYKIVANIIVTESDE